MAISHHIVGFGQMLEFFTFVYAQQMKTTVLDSKRSFFSLVELLIVISILAILMALLVPSLKRARGHALDIACIKNLKTLGIVTSMYAEDNRDTLPPSNFLAGTSFQMIYQGGAYGN